MKRRLLALAIATTTIVGSGSVIARQSTMTGPGLKRGSAAALTLPVPRSFDLSHVQPEHFAAALGKDPNRIFQFVRDEIAFEPYVGALRGPRGTLLAMAGNAIDRASLLASMLVASGQRVRFARGALPDTLAQQLVASLWVARPSAAATTTISPEVQHAADLMIASIQRDGVLLRDALRKSGYPPASSSVVSPDQLLAEAKNHYWIECWQHDAWVPMDPSFASATPGQSFARAAQTFDELPEAIFHRVDIRVRVEESTGEGSASRDVLHYESTAADLSGAEIVLSHEAGSGQEGNHVRPFFIIQQKRVDGEWFWLKPPPPNTRAVFVDALGGGGANPDPVAIAESIEFEFTLPTGGTETVVREVFDRVGPARRLKNENPTAVQIAGWTEAVTTAEFSAGIYDVLFNTGAIDATQVQNLSTPVPPDRDRIDAREGLRQINVGFAALSDAVLNRVVGDSGATYRLYLETPRIQIADMTINGGLARFSLDLRRDPVKIVTTAKRPEQLFYAHVLQGLVDGTIERMVVEQLAGSPLPDRGPGATSFSTSSIFESALAAKVPLVVVTRENITSATDAPPDVRARMTAALEGGNVLVAPKGPIAIGGRPRFAWWQIDTRSGATIAVTDEGLHQDTVEYVVTRRDGEIHFEAYINGRHMPYQARNFANGPMARQFISGLFKELEQNNITLVITRWTSLM